MLWVNSSKTYRLKEIEDSVMGDVYINMRKCKKILKWEDGRR